MVDKQGGSAAHFGKRNLLMEATPVQRDRELRLTALIEIEGRTRVVDDEVAINRVPRNDMVLVENEMVREFPGDCDRRWLCGGGSTDADEDTETQSSENQQAEHPSQRWDQPLDPRC